MNLAELRLLVDFNYWARDRLLSAVGTLTPEQYSRDLGSSFRSVRATLVHMYSAEWIWYTRWQGTSPTTPLSVDDYPDLSTLRAAWVALESQIRSYLDRVGEAGASRVMEYKLINGQPGKSVFWQMLQHVVNHGSYHRGQVTTMLRQLGAAPSKSMDLITFYRERAN
ncbi:MAG TPA: DinB family protein [Vicinamibacterales bacterium]|nr:DinB family protein [Vicinamibacterales bacterium]